MAMLTNNLSHCALSLCETDPASCATQLTSDEGFVLAACLGVPILIAILAPGIARGGIACKRDDDIAEASPRRPMYAPVNPPMFLCGVGLLPLDCGKSGLLTVIALLAFAVVVIFTSMATSHRPCTTALGSCRTISCVCGNLMPEGYTFMLVSLSITSLILVQRLSKMTHHHRKQHKVLKAAMVLGALLLTLTGVFPERYDSNDAIVGSFAVFYNLHLLGVFGSGLL